MSKANAIIKFLNAARSLANQGMSKEAIMQFAKNEFGEITELFQKQIDNIFKTKKGAPSKSEIGELFGFKNYPKKDEIFDDTVVKIPYDDQGFPFNPKDPLKNLKKQKEGIETISLEERMDRIKGTSKKLDEAIKEYEEIYKPKGPRDKKYTGGLVDVEPSLSDIGHGSDALMARTRLLSPGAQGTTSTGLNYLLAEDNDNIRIPFENGKNFEMYLREREQIERQRRLEQLMKEYQDDMNRKKVMEQKQMAAEGGRIGFSKGKLADKTRRKFMQLAGTSIGGLAALKAGLINLAKDAGPKVEMVKETVSKTPDYFFDLVSKIKMFGKEGTPLSERMNVTNYKNFELTEDISTGDMRITKQAGDPDGPGYKEEVMEYSKGGNPMEEGGQTIERYEEATLFPDMDGKMKDIEDGIEPDSIKEIMEEITEIKKADGGRIGFSKGKLAEGFLKYLADLGINSTTARFLEKVFGKEAMAEMPKRDPELFKGLLETTEMYRKRDKEGLKKYMKGFLPHMNDAELEEFIVGNPEIGDMSGVLLRLGSGRDYKAKIDMINEANKNRKLADLEVTEDMKRKPNASGGIANLLGE